MQVQARLLTPHFSFLFSAFVADRTYTGQQADGTGLMYYHARYYDPAAGQFISPDTLVPDPTNVMDYQRYAYARANPLRYSDPTGHYTIDELKEHFGVTSFDELMALFEEGGAYAGLEGWYDVLRAAQDGDRITAYNELAGGYTLTGVFMRSTQGKIQIRRNEGIVHESVFAQFGGIIRRGNAGQENIVAIGVYELSGQEDIWRRAVVGAQRHGDMSSCANIDCVAATIDGVGLVGAGLQIASPACMEFVAACNIAGKGMSGFATVAGISWTSYNVAVGNATHADLATTVATGAVGSLAKDPRVGLVAATVQTIWDLQISPIQPR